MGNFMEKFATKFSISNCVAGDAINSLLVTKRKASDCD